MQIIFVFLFLASLKASASQTDGRITLGGFASKEEYSTTSYDTTRNDYATASARLYLHSAKVMSVYDDFVLDLRDKNDFFNKLDKERLELNNKNDFQVRQASYSYNKKSSGVFSLLGRFPVLQAGSAFTDGLALGYNVASDLKTALFGGYNPKSDERYYLKYEDKSQIYGLYIEYTPRTFSWYKRFYMTNAFTQETFDSQLDRSYVFHNSVYQWNERSMLSTLFYLDFVPRTYLQNSSINYSQGWGETYTSILTYSNVDVIQYRRIQDVRETLTPSAYQEAKLAIKQKLDGTGHWIASHREGVREVDNYVRRISSLGFDLPGLWSKRFDLYLQGSHKFEFVKEGSFLKFGLGYFSDLWEFNFDLENGIEKQTDGTTLHPIIFEATAGRQFSQKFFSIFSGQVSKDEQVEITSFFFKLSYRFGDKETPPLRDGATPRGRL